MRKCFLFAVVSLVAFAISGCMSYEALIQKILPSEVDSFARACIQDAVNKNVEGIISRIPPADKNQNLREGVEQLSAFTQKGRLLKITTAGVHANTFEGTTTYNVTYELQYPNAWQIANIALTTEGDSIALKSFHVNDIEDSLVVLNRFTFRDKGFSHYLFFVMNIIYLAIVGGSFVLCLLTRNLQKKWLWAIISLIGFVEFTFSWTTGEWGIKPLSIGLKISTFVPPFPYMASILTFYIPVGALAFLFKRASMKATKPAQPGLPMDEKNYL
jgi:hypothetical protein